jgi:hypothetical protein
MATHGDTTRTEDPEQHRRDRWIDQVRHPAAHAGLRGRWRHVAPTARRDGGGRHPHARLAGRSARRDHRAGDRGVLQPAHGQPVHEGRRPGLRAAPAQGLARPARGRESHPADPDAGAEDALLVHSEGRERERTHLHPGRAPADHRDDHQPPRIPQGVGNPHRSARAEADRGDPSRGQHGADQPGCHPRGGARPGVAPEQHAHALGREGRRRGDGGGDPQPLRSRHGEVDHGRH